MKKILILLSLIFISTPCFAWISETGGGVVSSNEVIVRPSLEATEVLKSDVLSTLYGVTILGGSSANVSIDSGGIIRTGAVTASSEVVKLHKGQYFSWLDTLGKEYKTGLSDSNIYTVDPPVQLQKQMSGQSVVITSLFSTSINTTYMRVSGSNTITSSYSTGTCTFTFNNGLLQTATC